MTANIQPVSSRSDLLRWIAAVALFGAVVGINLYWSGGSYLLLRSAGVVVLTALAGWLAWNTATGRNFALMLNNAKIEAEKIVWPSRDETWQTTLLVLAVVTVVSLVLWMSDSLFGLIINAIVGG